MESQKFTHLKLQSVCIISSIKAILNGHRTAIKKVIGKSQSQKQPPKLRKCVMMLLI